jgi:hypothetical protein
MKLLGALITLNLALVEIFFMQEAFAGGAVLGILNLYFTCMWLTLTVLFLAGRSWDRAGIK